MAPAHPFLEQDTPNLAALHLDALIMRRTLEGVQAPLDILVGAVAVLASLTARVCRGCGAGQSDDGAALLLGQPSVAPGFQLIA